jgi:hypothetical protein
MFLVNGNMSNRWKDLKCVVFVVVRRRPSVPIEFPRKYISYITAF